MNVNTENRLTFEYKILISTNHNRFGIVSSSGLVIDSYDPRSLLWIWIECRKCVGRRRKKPSLPDSFFFLFYNTRRTWNKWLITSRTTTGIVTDTNVQYTNQIIIIIFDIFCLFSKNVQVRWGCGYYCIDRRSPRPVRRTLLNIFVTSPARTQIFAIS